MRTLAFDAFLVTEGGTVIEGSLVCEAPDRWESLKDRLQGCFSALLVKIQESGQSRIGENGTFAMYLEVNDTDDRVGGFVRIAEAAASAEKQKIWQRIAWKNDAQKGVK